MSSVALDPRGLVVQVRENAERAYLDYDSNDWYRSTARQARFGEQSTSRATMGLCDEQKSSSGIAAEQVASPTIWNRVAHWFRGRTEKPLTLDEFQSVSPNDVQAFDQFVTFLRQQESCNSVEDWNKKLAYTDFDSWPVKSTILILAISCDKQDDIPVWRVQLNRCRKNLQSLGIHNNLFESLRNQYPADSQHSLLLKAARMVDALETQVATDDYLDSAIAFEQLNEVRSALACVYRNARYRLRDGQIKELDSDVRGFEFSEAKVDTMLAILTATAPVKRNLASRSTLYANIQRTLKKRGQLERGLLDGLQ